MNMKGIHMAFNNIASLVEMARGDEPGIVAVVEAQAEHVLEGVARSMKDGIVVPYLIGNKEKIVSILHEMKENIADYHIMDSPDIQTSAYKAVQMVKRGEADFLMKGNLNTADLLRAVLNKETGLPHGKVMTHLSLVDLPAYHKVLVLNDCAIIPHPTLEQKVEQIKIVTSTLHKLGYGDDLKIGIVCAGETPNLKIQESAEAVELKKMNEEGALVGCIIEGPISIDLALSEEAVKEKGYKSPLAADIDVLLFPSLVSGSVFAKTITLFANATVVGMTVGASCPLSISSRAASSDFKYYSLALAAAVSKKEGDFK